MKRFGRILAILGGIGVTIWAMRDRFISLTVPREPEPPSFRSPPSVPTVPPASPAGTEQQPVDSKSAEPDDLTDVRGIGPVFAQRLADAGITTFAQLAATGEEELRKVLGSRLGDVDGILEDSRRLAGT